MEVKKVLERRDGTRYIVIPRESNLLKGDFIILSKLVVKKDVYEKEINETIKEINETIDEDDCLKDLLKDEFKDKKKQKR